MKTFCILLFLILPFSNLKSQAYPVDSLQNIIDEGLIFLSETQEKTTVKDSIFKGEWPSTMGLKNGYILLGKATDFRDSNCFTQAAIFNLLVELYEEDTSRAMILPMLQAAFPEVLSYRSNGSFNFWKLLAPNRDLSKKQANPAGYKVHRPTNYRLPTRFINKAANVANDADDTASGNLAIYNYLRVFGNDSIRSLYTDASLFNQYRDQKRNNYHWYNYIHKIPRPSGAYQTWLSNEYQFEKWNFAKQVIHNCFFYAKWSSCYPHPFKLYVPWGANDVDAVVNANIIHYLGKSGQLEKAQGSAGAVSLFQNAIKRKRWSRAGIYYPNRYYFHYMYAKTLPFLNDSLKNETQLLVNHLIHSQHENGSFKSRLKVNKKDVLQSTVYAFNALLELEENGVEIPRDITDKALKYILSQRKSDGSWVGGVFFSGGTVVRNTLYFKSDAFTTALAINGIAKYLPH